MVAGDVGGDDGLVTPIEFQYGVSLAKLGVHHDPGPVEFHPLTAFQSKSENPTLFVVSSDSAVLNSPQLIAPKLND